MNLPKDKPMPWSPAITAASVIFQDDRYLFVKEMDKERRIPVFNQPAGHLEPGETIIDAAIRETIEETTWKISIVALLGISLVKSNNKTTYLRHTFLALPIERDENAVLDSDIISMHWLSYEEIEVLSDQLRTPVVMEAIRWHRSGVIYPLGVFK